MWIVNFFIFGLFSACGVAIVSIIAGARKNATFKPIIISAATIPYGGVNLWLSDRARRKRELEKENAQINETIIS